jgi:Flp pilus assembly protein TadD
MLSHRFIVLWGLTNLLQAQNGTFKRPLTKADTIFLKKEAVECFGFNPSLQLSYNNLDFETDKRREGDKPATLENIELLKKKVEKEPGNAEVYSEIAGMYGRLNMPDEAREYRKQSFDVISKVLKEHPDSANALSALGGIYMSVLQMDSALSKYRQALYRDPLNRDANRLIPFVHIMNNHFDSAYAFIIKQINKYPDNYTVHEALPVYYIYKFYDQLNQYNQLANIDEERLRPENIMTLKLLKDYSDADKNDFRREYLYRITYQVCYSTLITYRTVNDSLFDVKNIRFATTLKDASNLKPQEEFFNKCLHEKEPENKYLAHKMLGNIALLLNQPKQAIPHLKKAIELKPIQKSTIGNNAAEDYDNLITAYFILKDTLQYEKIIFEKLKLRPAIDPVVSDYVMAGKICVHKKKYAEAETWFKEGLALNKTNADAYLGLALTQFLNNNYTDALTNINEAYKLNDKKWELYILYGIVSLCKNDPINAFEAFKAGRKLHNSKWIKEELMENYFDLFK